MSRAADIRESFARQGLMATLGAEIAAIGEGTVTITAPVRPETGQQHGFAHAGLTFAIGDSAAGYAALSAMPEGTEVLTAEMKINLIAPARGPVLRATGRVEKPGRRLVVVTARVEDEGGVVALLQGTMVPVGG